MKSTITLKNKSHYFVPSVSRDLVTVQNPDLYLSARQKIEGMETRLYYEYESTKANGGFTQFITLTYNDASIPSFCGFPCIDSHDIRHFFHDNRFFKDLGKKHGYNYKYYVGCEFGEGRGVRGAGNNPHYHILLFFTPFKDWYKVNKRTGEYQSLTPSLKAKEVAKAIRRFWCGPDYWRISPTKYRFGIVSFGKVHRYGLIQDFRGISYVSKYCVKEQYFKDVENKIKANPSIFYEYAIEHSDVLTSREDFNISVQDIIKKFRSRFSYRLMCSHGLGLSALNDVSDLMKPRVKVASKRGFKKRSLPLYLYRKLYCDVKKDHLGVSYYTSNELGKKYKLYNLPLQIDKLASDTYSRILSLYYSPQLLDKLINYDDNIKSYPFADRDSFLHRYVVTDSQISQIGKLLQQHVPFRDSEIRLFELYSIYKKVYKDRYYCCSGLLGFDKPLQVSSDFNHSLLDIHKFSFDTRFCLPSNKEGSYYSYDFHPCFSPYISLFNWFDDMHSYFVVQKDKVDKENYERWKRLKNINRNCNKINSYVC